MSFNMQQPCRVSGTHSTTRSKSCIARAALQAHLKPLRSFKRLANGCLVQVQHVSQHASWCPAGAKTSTVKSQPWQLQALQNPSHAESSGSTYQFRKDEDDGSMLLHVGQFLEDREGEVPVGVYAVYDQHKNCQFIGSSYNLVSAIKAHLQQAGPELCAYVRPMVFANHAMATHQNLETEALNWIAACDTPPPGNGAESGLWKIEEPGSTGEAVDEQHPNGQPQQHGGCGCSSGEAKHGGEAAASSSCCSSNNGGSTPVVSPFTRANVHRSIGNAGPGPHAEMTMESVDSVLDEVRPYLMADGGNVEVVGVEAGYVYLRLEGTCSSCPSSSSTMKMGIERALKGAFGDALKEVIQVDKKDVVSATVENVDMHLDMLRGAIHNFGGKVEVLEVEGSKCVVRYKGPKPIGKGVQAAIRERFAQIKEVVLVD